VRRIGETGKVSIGRAERELKSRGLTSQSLLIPTQVLESRRPSVQSLDTEVTRYNHLISTSIPSTNNEKPLHRLLLGGIELERLVTVIKDLFVSRRRHVLPACDKFEVGRFMLGIVSNTDPLHTSTTDQGLTCSSV
jgi:hypothetical protein